MAIALSVVSAVEGVCYTATALAVPFLLLLALAYAHYGDRLMRPPRAHFRRDQPWGAGSLDAQPRPMDPISRTRII